MIIPDNNALQKELEKDEYEESMIVDRNEIPRIPWQDGHICIDGQAAMDVAYNFIHRWNSECKRDQRCDYMLFPEFSCIIRFIS